MTAHEKLKAIVQRAKEKGWDGDTHWLSTYRGRVLSSRAAGKEAEDLPYQFIIFDHSFLQAFFGAAPCVLVKEVGYDDEEEFTGNYLLWIPKELSLDSHEVLEEQPEWQVRAQRLVLEDNRIDYLYRFIEQAK